MATIRELVTTWGFRVDLAAIERFDQRIGRLRGRVDGVGRNIEQVARGAQAFGGRMSLAITAPIVGLGILSLKAAANFEAGMNRVDALTTIVGTSLQDLEKQALMLGSSTKFSATQAADAMGFMAQAGLNSQQIFNAMPDALNLAAAANIGLAETADLVTNVMSGMGIESNELGIAVDVLAKTFISSNTDLSQLGQSMKLAGPIAKGFGLDIQETTAILGLMGNAGIQASLSGTALRNSLTRLALPSAKAAKILSTLKVKTDDGSGGIRNLVDIMFDLEKSGASTTEIMEIFGLRAGPAMEVLISQGNESLRDFITKLRGAGGTAKEVADKQLRGLTGAWISLKSAMEGLSIAIAKSGLLAFVTSAVKKITALVRKLSSLNPNILRFGTVVLGVVAGIGPLVLILGTAALAFKSLAIAAGFANVGLLTIPLIIFAIIAAIALLADDFIVFSKGGNSVIGLMVKQFEILANQIKKELQPLIDLVSFFIELIASIPSVFNKAVANLREKSKLFDDIVVDASFAIERSARAGNIIKDFLFGEEKTSAPARPKLQGEDLARALRIAGTGPAPAILPGSRITTIQVTAPVTVNLPEGTPQEQAKNIAVEVKEALQTELLGIQNDEPALD